MDACHASLAKSTIFFGKAPFPSRYSTFPTEFRRKPTRILTNYSVPFLKIPSRGSSAARRREALPVYSQFRGSSRRRNSLRKKLVPTQDQVRLFPEVSNPEFREYGSNGHRLGMDLDSEKESTGAVDSKRSEFSGNSALWDKLENWVDRYKEDSEFWGVGTGPIFTIFQGSDGNVIRVSVNEDEILRRNRIRAWSLEGNEERGELKDLNSKISRARLIAKDIEAGAYNMARNSSIAKFVVEGKKSSFLSLIHAVSSQRESLAKIFPRIGFMVLCYFCIYGAAKKFFGGYNDVERTREEVEMLRRKKKSRIEREKLHKGTVEVLQNGDELPLISGTRPPLDRNELMKSIMQAKKPGVTMVLSDPSGHFSANNHDFDKKVREIREMVRKVHEVEEQNQSSNKHRDKQDELSSIILDTKSQLGDVENHANHEAKSANGSLHHDNATKTSSHAEHEKRKKISLDVRNMNILGEDMAFPMDEFSKVLSSNTFGASKSNDSVDVEGLGTSILKNSQKKPFGIDVSDAGAQDIVSLNIKDKVEVNKLNNNTTGGDETDRSLSAISRNERGKPKIIISPKEAKEYLTAKCKIPAGLVLAGQAVHLKKAAEVLSSSADRSVGDLHRIRETTEASGLALGFSDDNDAFSLPKRSLMNIVESYENDDKVKNSSVEAEVVIQKNLGFQNGGLNGRSQKVGNFDADADLDDVQIGHNDYGAGNINTSNDYITSGTKNHEDDLTILWCQNQRHSDRTSQNKIAKSKDAQSDNLSAIHDQVDGMMLEILSHTPEFNILPEEQLDQVAEVGRSEYAATVCDFMTNKTEVKKDSLTITSSNVLKSSESDAKPEITQSFVSTNIESSLKKDQDDVGVSCSYPVRSGVSGHLEPGRVDDSYDASKAEDGLKNLSFEANIPSVSGNSNCLNEGLPKTSQKSWTEENFHQFDSIIKKIGLGFQENYMMAKAKAEGSSFSSAEINKLSLWGEDEELEWMKDEKLQEIVFQVRENELAGRDPFHLMDSDEQQAFFKGLECKAQKVNEKLAGVHEWIHSRVENLDYGADGISLDDPLEKIIPRWKGPAIDEDPEFLKKFTNMGNPVLAESIRHLPDLSKDKQDNLQRSQNLANSDVIFPYAPVNDTTNFSGNGTSTSPKSLIECSDGSSRPGKKKLKEHWQHTKKWSQGFLEVYNAETDPEVKSVLKDMGKDLDRWITDKEIKDVADLMTRIPKKKKRFIEKKMKKIKREVEMYGAQAVVSKYKEYADEKEEDYLWWFDLRFVLCIELYTVEDDSPRVGFYSLEMAEDLELNPKQYHVIAFEDAGDAKNFCHIVQAQMDMLGSGKAFVVARPPKDAFREAKANGFSLTLIRKGQVKLNVDQTLEEVEEELKEVGSEIYQDKIMNERGVDIRSLMKGLVVADRSSRR